MVSAKNEDVESVFNPFQLVKDVFLPLESGIRKAAKDLEHCWPGSKKGTNHSLEVYSKQLNGGSAKNGNKVQVSSLKKKSYQCVVSDEKKKGVFIKVPIKTFLGFFPHNCGSNGHKIDASSKGLNDVGDMDGSCSKCIQLAVMWSLLLNGVVQSFPIPFKVDKKQFHKTSDEDKVCADSFTQASKLSVSCDVKQKEAKGQFVATYQNDDSKHKEGNNLSIECCIGFVCNQLIQNLQKFDFGIQESECRSGDSSPAPHPANQVNHLKSITSILEGRKADVNGFLGNMRFARVGGVPSSIVEVTSVKEEGDDSVTVTASSKEETGGNSAQKMANGLLSIPLSNVERLRSTLSTVSLTELIELVPYLGRSSKDYPDKKKLFSVQDFFRYTESEGRRFFEELDRDGDGLVTMEDLEVAMRKRKLPRRYAREFMHRTRSHLFSKSFGWKQFLSLMEQKEPTILRAYTTLCLSKSGTLQKSEILASLKNAGLPANEDQAVAMMRFLNADTEESISYGHFRNFMLLLPSDRLQEDPRSIWFEAATVVAVEPPVELPASSVLKAALAGGLSCALSCSLMHPVDTIKTRVQASTLTFPEIMSKLPQIGVRGLYRGSIPAILGQFSSHGLRTGIFEASKLILINVAPNVPEIQVQSVASFCSTFLGTAVRIPNEVLKQRLQAGIFDNVGQAIVGTWNQDGLKGFFRGTGATLFREVPFYVAGMGLYAESKKVAQRLLGRDLEPWETIAVGALSGGLTAVITTPFDVMKTRMMTAPGGRQVSMSLVAVSILRHEGPLGLFKGAVPRFFWIAPLGAMNFAGYELAKKAMERNEDQNAEQLSQKKLASSG
ncbi:S-adenosylmethionine mitochondrial carrier protein [Actinidia chinensis var. chinensis]|uniref:S-adenosylmethionine mitochondrial carrier protein n=1 Tax=Actinidia chinensis var. chinensis TaxID=1590841 RepID=A0A2R6Q9Q9_ACTCC|nr:S-adenosylmethionine mitochondrial carrier protein [Actinidia chinensis var. chinensis]